MIKKKIKKIWLIIIICLITFILVEGFILWRLVWQGGTIEETQVEQDVQGEETYEPQPEKGQTAGEEIIKEETQEGEEVEEEKVEDRSTEGEESARKEIPSSEKEVPKKEEEKETFIPFKIHLSSRIESNRVRLEWLAGGDEGIGIESYNIYRTDSLEKGWKPLGMTTTFKLPFRYIDWNPILGKAFQ
jgi:hypothetical protein